MAEILPLKIYYGSLNTILYDLSSLEESSVFIPLYFHILTIFRSLPLWEARVKSGLLFQQL